MDIVLNTNFNNPNLPVVPLPGFFDNFNRPAATNLGNTSRENRQWQIVQSGTVTPEWSITENNTATLTRAGSTSQAVVVDGLATNGELSATLTAVSPTRWGGMAIRVHDLDNFIVLREPSSGSKSMALYEFVDGSNTLLDTGGEVAEGDRIKIEFTQQNVWVYQNDELRISATVENTTGTRHGLYSYNPGPDNPASEWDDIEFIAK